MIWRHAHHLQRVAPLFAVLGFAFGATQGARAADFQFSPVRVDLTAHNRAASVLLTNKADAPLRIEVQALGWTQRPTGGQPLLAASTALLVFPELLTIPPHAQRRLRVATTDPPGAKEAAYMVSIAEIGAFEPKKQRGAGVTLSLQADVPVFVAPATGRRAGAIADVKVAKRTLTFAVVNTGTLHFVIKNSRVTGQGVGERALFGSNLEGGVVMAGGKREFRVDLPRKDCGALRALTVRLEAGDQRLVQTLDVPPGACDT